MIEAGDGGSNAQIHCELVLDGAQFLARWGRSATGGGGRLRGAGNGDAACLGVDLGGGELDVASQNSDTVAGVADIALVIATMQWSVGTSEHGFGMLQGGGLIDEVLLGLCQHRAGILALDSNSPLRGFGVLKRVDNFEAWRDEASTTSSSRP